MKKISPAQIISLVLIILISVSSVEAENYSTADLDVISVDFMPSSVAVGESFFVNFTIKNIGGLTTDDFFVIISLYDQSKKLVKNSSKELYKDKISPGETVVFKQSVTITDPVPFSSYYVTAKADYMREVNESNRSNNLGYSEKKLNIEPQVKSENTVSQKTNANVSTNSDNNEMLSLELEELRTEIDSLRYRLLLIFLVSILLILIASITTFFYLYKRIRNLEKEVFKLVIISEN